MLKKTIALTLLLFFIGQISAQELLTPTFGFSSKKLSYITLLDGTELQGNVVGAKYTKLLIETIKIKVDGKKRKIDADQIKFMYLPPSGLDKLVSKLNFITDASKWNDEKLNQDFLNKGYVYYELADVYVKKKKKQLLMQLLNPGFSKYIKVYLDPRAGETASVGFAGIKMAGGIAKSYYVAKTGETAHRLKKKDYKSEFIPMWKSCKEVGAKYPDPKWRDLVKHIIAFSECAQ